MEFKRILVVDDEPLMRDFLVETLQRKKYVVDAVGSGSQAIEKIKGDYFDLVITDIRMPEVSGMEVLDAVKKNSPETEVVMITAFGTIENAVEAMKLGAYHYLQKPFQADAIEILVERAIERQRLRDENRTLRNDNTQLRNQLKEKYTFSSIVGSSDVMQKVYDTIEVIAPSKATVLIHGESGTGKELVARAIHYNSPRQSRSFIKLNCAALPEGLMESELFGHEKGAFTGAIRSTKGRFELADNGTLLLDEIGEMSLPLQAKLLRVLQEREFEKVGNPTPLSVDVRVIATTHRDLKEEVKNNRFREDLYYRLNVVPIYLPSLRERIDDIPLLVDHFITKYCEENGKQIEGIEDDALELLMAQEWKGNVRELENQIERAVVLCREETLSLRYFQFDREISGAAAGPGMDGIVAGMTLREVEKRLILSTLDQEKNNRTRASEILGISVRTLRNKLNEYSKEGVFVKS
ncbi:MAG: sigma-54-dependent Fis family transcriptional regulator [Candidatus Glassbacteria bacterium]|nr:sigma-54-dependent Fis family transcriptional regulator [Candidatus Glassbacteria bacterium]